MAGVSTPAMAAAAAQAGALGSLGCAFHSVAALARDVTAVRAAVPDHRALNLNFFCHVPPDRDPGREAAAQARLSPWHSHFGTDPEPCAPDPAPFGDRHADAIKTLRPSVVSFHFGLPKRPLLERVRATGAVILASATTVAEARWLEDRGVDAIIAQGAEAGGHSGWFLPRTGDTAGLFALLPRVVDAVSVPVIAAGAIGDGRAVAAALTLGAAGVQVGTALVASPESAASTAHKDRLLRASGDDTLATRAFSGRTARGLANAYARETAGVDDWPDFPLMNAATAPLRRASAADGTGEAAALWAGQGAGLTTGDSTGTVIARIIGQTQAIMGPDD